MFFLEFISIASVPFFVTSILNPELVLLKLDNYFNIDRMNFIRTILF